MKDIYNILKDLCAIVSVSGGEEKTAAYIAHFMEDLCDEIKIDAMGNVLCRKGVDPNKETVILSAHMDEIGFLVTDADEDGFVLLAPIGGVHAESAAYTRVRFESGRIGNLIPPHGTKAADLDAKKLLCDIGAKNRAGALRLVKQGERCATVSPLVKLAGGRISSRALDNRLGVATLLSAAEKLKEKKDLVYNLVFLFTVQEEVGLRGAAPGAFAVDADYCINVDVTPANDENGAKGSVKLGHGPTVKYKDRSVVCHRRIIEHLERTAKAENIPTQVEILTMGGTDTGPIQSSRAGVVSGAISLPLRYIHSDCETADARDIEGARALLLAAVTHEIA